MFKEKHWLFLLGAVRFGGNESRDLFTAKPAGFNEENGVGKPHISQLLRHRERFLETPL